MNLIDFYAREVGYNLPVKMKADIEKEIRSLIEDNLEDESQKTGRPVDEEMQVEVLQRLGPPEKVAASYLPPRYLIGPELYPHFLTTLRIVLVVVAIVSTIGIGASLGANPETSNNIIEIIARLFGGLLNSLVNAAGLVVLIFAIIQIAVPNLRLSVKEMKWDPRDLLKIVDPERVSVGGSITEIVFTTLALVIFNLYPQWIGIYGINDQGIYYVGILSEAFVRYLPWLTVLWVMDIIFKIWLIGAAKWTKSLHWTKICLTVLSIFMLAWILSGPAIIAISPDAINQAGWNLEPGALQRVNEGMQTGMRVLLGLIIAGRVIDLGRQLYKLYRQRLPDPLIFSR